MTPVTFLGELVLPPMKPNTFEMLLKYLRGDEYFYKLQCSTATWTTFWIFSLPKLLINSFVVESSWGCSRHFQQTLQVGIRCPRPVPTQVKCKNPGIRRWGIAQDMTVTLQINPKSWLLINSHQTSAAKAPNMASIANQAYRPWERTYTMYMCPRCFRWCSALAVQPSQPTNIRHNDLFTHRALD